EITLLPKRSGTLIIPAISIGDATSQPITLEVQPKPANTQASADVFLHSEIDHSDAIYVQQQLIYTLRLYYATSISDHGLTDLDLDNVLMVQLGNRKDFEARIDGRLYNVAEWQFALYPQSSGELVIPPQTFSGRVRIQNRYSLGGLKQIRIQSPEHKINVQPVPDSFPANAQWLPARSV
ncbi:protein BatD, partial [Oceanospirillum sp. HFRX-1_2]